MTETILNLIYYLVQTFKPMTFSPETIYAKTPTVELVGHTAEQQQYISYAFEISGYDKWFVLMLKAENRDISIGAQSKTNDWGFCQISKRWHPQIVNDSRFFTDWKWQMDKCW